VATSIVLNDALATPVAHTFVPIGRDANGVFWFEDQSQANAIGFWKISVLLKRPPPPAAGDNSSGRSFRVSVGLHEPILETVSNSTVSGIAPAPTVGYTSRVTSEFILPERSTLQNRMDIRAMVASLFNSTQVKNCVETLTYIQ